MQALKTLSQFYTCGALAQDLAWDLPWEHSAILQLSCNLWESLPCPSHLPCPTPASSRLDGTLCPLGLMTALRWMFIHCPAAFEAGQKSQQASLVFGLISFSKQEKTKIRRKKKAVFRVESKADEGYRFVCSPQPMVYLNNIARILKVQSFNFKSKHCLWIYSCVS